MDYTKIYIYGGNMAIVYRTFDDNIFEQIVNNGGEWIKECVYARNDVFTLAAIDSDLVVGFICVTPRALTSPLEHIKDAYIEVYDVHENYRRQGIGKHLVTCAENWARENGFKQIRTHHSNDAVAAINMSYSLNYSMCPHVYSKEEGCAGYHVAKVLNI
jgi:GNAT superfamily N-acetyltransferase